MVKQRLKKVDVAADGQCLFNSVAYLILYHKNKKTTNYKKLATKLRNAVCDMLEVEVDSEKKKKYINRNLIHQLSAELESISNAKMNATNENSITKRAEKYIEVMRKKKTWGGIIELNFLFKIVSEVLGFKGIKVYHLKRDKLKKNKVSGLTHVGKLYQIKGGMDTLINNKKIEPHLDIILHDYEIGGRHYDPLIPVPKITTRKVGK